MPSGFRTDKEAWVKDYEDARNLAQEIATLIQERNVQNGTGGPEASRKTATARRKIGTLGTDIDKLLSWLDTDAASGLSEAEKNRRRDMLSELKNRREQMQFALKRSAGNSDRNALLQGSSSAAAVDARETEATAELDNRGLLQLQTNVMKEQDQQLESMEKTIFNTKHIALAIGEEVDLQTRLLDDLEDDVEVTQSRTKAATSRIRQILKNSSHWKGGFCIFVLIVTLVLVLVLVGKLSHLFH